MAAHGDPMGPRPLRAVPDGGYPNWEGCTRTTPVLAAHWREPLGREITAIEDVEQPPEGEDAISTAPQRVARVLDTLL